MSQGITRRDSLKTAIAAFCAAPIAKLGAENGGQINSKHQAWILEWFRTSKPEACDVMQALMIGLRPDLPVPPGWWQEDIGPVQGVAMNERTAAGTRAYIRRDLKNPEIRARAEKRAKGTATLGPLSKGRT
jgi:hypothetical protein